MKVRYISSACVILEHEDIKVLCDPWLTDGVYYGSWYHYPPLEFRPEDFDDVDYIYISHIHHDHMDVDSLKRISKNIPVLIHDFADKFLLRIIKEIGFHEVIEIPHQESYKLGNDFEVEILAADNCDPVVCGKYFGCKLLGEDNSRTKQVDSLAVFSSSNYVVVNTNDCPYDLTRYSCDYIAKNYSHIDLLLVGYTGAGPYPQCYENYSPIEKAQLADLKKNQFLNKTIGYLKHLQPKYFMPFAGQYTLGGSLAYLNDLRGTPELEELPDLFCTLIAENNLDTKMVLLNSGEWFYVDSYSSSNTFVPPDPLERKKYIEEILIKKQFLYEGERNIPKDEWIDLTNKLREAQKRMIKYQDSRWGNYRSSWKIYIDAGQELIYCVPFNGDTVNTVRHGEEIEPYIRISLDYTLLVMILERKAHWNNAQIGSHLRYFRSPDILERPIHQLISYLHC